MIKPISNSNLENTFPLEGIYNALILFIESNIHNFPSFLNEAALEYKKEPILIAKVGTGSALCMNVVERSI